VFGYYLTETVVPYTQPSRAIFQETDILGTYNDPLSRVQRATLGLEGLCRRVTVKVRDERQSHPFGNYPGYSFSQLKASSPSTSINGFADIWIIQNGFSASLDRKMSLRLYRRLTVYCLPLGRAGRTARWSVTVFCFMSLTSHFIQGMGCRS
jgi:hypothetical protein